MAEKKKREEVQLAPSSSGSVMSMPSAIVAILVAFALGALVGNVIGRNSSAEGEEIAMADRDHGGRGGEGAGAAPAGDGSDQTRYRIDVSDQMPQRGPDNALVTIVMWSDYQCPFCSRVEPTLARITEQFRDRGPHRLARPRRCRSTTTPRPPPRRRARPTPSAATRRLLAACTTCSSRTSSALERANARPPTPQQRGPRHGALPSRRSTSTPTRRPSVEADSAAGRTASAPTGTPAFFINGREPGGRAALRAVPAR
jgi:hypothetical protein